MDASLAQGTVLPAIAMVVSGLPLALSWYPDHAYGKWSKVPMSLDMTGADAARRMLAGSGIASVGIAQVEGRLKDGYIPHANRICLSAENYEGGSVASVAVACHEAGHAIQDATGYALMRMRLVNSKSCIMLGLLGVALSWVGLARAATALFTLGLVSSILMLVMEIDASMRAVRYVDSITGSPTDRKGVRAVLTAAAMSYVAFAMICVLMLA